MKLYRVSIDIKKLYTVEIEAESEAEACKKADAMDTTEVYDMGELEQVESESVFACEIPSDLEA